MYCVRLYMSKYVKTDLIFETLYDTYAMLTNTEEKHLFVAFEILNVLFRRAQHEYA